MSFSVITICLNHYTLERMDGSYTTSFTYICQSSEMTFYANKNNAWFYLGFWFIIFYLSSKMSFGKIYSKEILSHESDNVM